MTSRYKTPVLKKDKAELVIEQAKKAKLNCLVAVRQALQRFDDNKFEPVGDTATTYNLLRDQLKDLMKLLSASTIQRRKCDAIENFAIPDQPVNLKSGPPKSAVCDSDVDAVFRNQSGDSLAVGASAGHPVNYVGDRGSYSQCSGVESCSGRKEFIHSIR